MTLVSDSTVAYSYFDCSLVQALGLSKYINKFSKELKH